VLRSNDHAHAVRETEALERLACGRLRDLPQIRLLRDVRDDQRVQPFGRQQFEHARALGVREMTASSGDPALQRRRIGAAREESRVVVELEDQNVCTLELARDVRIRTSHVREDHCDATLVLESERDGRIAIVGDRHGAVAQFVVPCACFQHVVASDGERCLTLRAHGPGMLQHRVRGMERGSLAARDDAGGTRVIEVTVRHEDVPDRFGPESGRGHPCEHRIAAEACIHERAQLAGAEKGRIAFTAAREDLEMHAATLTHAASSIPSLMRVHAFLIFVLLPVACSSIQHVSSTADVAARLEADVAWLADDAREGRRAGTEAGLEAGRWIEARMRELGLEPGGSDGSFQQEFQVPLEPRAAGGSFLAGPGGVRVPEAEARLAPLFCAEAGRVEAPLAYCGYGIELAARDWNDFAGRDLAGRIAIVVRGSPKSPPKPPEQPVESADPHGAAPANPHGAAPANPHGDVQLVAAGDPFVNAGLVFTKVMNAKRKGASAVILLQHPSDAEKPVLAFHEGGSGRAGIPCIALGWKDAEKLFGAELGAWTKELESTPSSASSGISSTFTVAADVARGHGTATNVLGIVPGVDRSRVVVLGAHYDHLGFGGTGSLAPGKRSIHNGADDNASGTAAVLEVARELSAGPPPACDVLFALWSGEELGLLGSEWWADHPTVPFERVALNVNLDMVGRAGNGKLQILGAGSAAEFSAWLAEAGPAADLELAVNASSSALAGSSDHATFAKRKKPVLHLFSGLHTDYHKPTDDIESFEAEGAARVTALTLDLVRRGTRAPNLAFVEPPPAVPGEKRIQSGFNAWFGSVPNYAFEGPGVKIDGTSPGSPAENAGFLAGDVLVQVGEVEIGTIYDFTYALQHYKPGDVVLVAFQRDGKREDTRVTLSSRGLR